LIPWKRTSPKIAKKVILSIIHPDSDFDERPTDRKGKYDYKLHLHLDVVEDLSSMMTGVEGTGLPTGSHAASSSGTMGDRTRRESGAAASGMTTTTCVSTVPAETETTTTTSAVV
jgi:hypothetical protein